MEYQNEHQRRMAILEAALPYAAPNSRHAIQLYLQADALLALARNAEPLHAEEYALEAAEHAGMGVMEPQNRLQEMLLGIQEHLTPGESEMVQSALNFLNVSRLLRRYREFNQNQTAGTSLRDFLISQMNPEQKMAFEQLQNIMYNGEGA